MKTGWACNEAWRNDMGRHVDHLALLNPSRPGPRFCPVKNKGSGMGGKQPKSPQKRARASIPMMHEASDQKGEKN